MGGDKDSSRTRVQPIFSAVLARDPTGASWLPRLLEAGADAHPDSWIRDPGRLSKGAMEKSASKKSELRCFEYQVQPDRRLLSWCVENPQRLRAPTVSDPPKESELKRRSLICDEPAGTRLPAQNLARSAVASQPVNRPAWWRFERATEVDCVLATDRLVLCVEGKREERLSPDTRWIAGRHQVARNLEAAWRLAGIGRVFAVLVCVESQGDPLADPAFVRDSLEVASPHLFPAERAALANAYLGQLSWIDICAAVGVEYQTLPTTVADLPRSSG
jgi:hypothetical protein